MIPNGSVWLPAGAVGDGIVCGGALRRIDAASRLVGAKRRLEWAPGPGQAGGRDRAGMPGFRGMEAHGGTPGPQRRVQAPGRPGIPGRRNPARVGEAPRHVPAPDPHPGREVRGRRLRQGCARCRPDSGLRGARCRLGCLVGRQALGLEFPKGALRSRAPARSGPPSAIAGPAAPRSRGGTIG